MTLIELMLATAIMAMLVVGLATMASAVSQHQAYSEGYGDATQHGRVILERISRTVAAAASTPDLPGVIVLEESLVGWTFPETLVVWAPAGPPANAGGPPLVSELIVFGPDPAAPQNLVEVAVPGDTTPAPATADLVAWQATVAAIRANPARRQLLLTDRLRTAQITELASAPGAVRGCVRFHLQLRPSAADWAAYQSGAAWNSLPWVQDIYGAQTGLRQTRVAVELQLLPGPQAGDLPAVPLFGSAARYDHLPR